MKEENDPLWQLLGRARSAESSPFFAAKVLRRLEQSSSAQRAPNARLAWAAAFILVGSSLLTIWWTTPSSSDQWASTFESVELTVEEEQLQEVVYFDVIIAETLTFLEDPWTNSWLESEELEEEASGEFNTSLRERGEWRAPWV